MKPLSALTNLTGKTAVVTGGAVGIGLGVVRRLVEAGANVVIGDADETAAATAVEELDGHVSAYTADVSREPDAKGLVAAAVERFGSLDILVNNAGIFPLTLVTNMTALADIFALLALGSSIAPCGLSNLDLRHR
jgi:2-deoxy-D-gluconate 3-dehydrogenase